LLPPYICVSYTLPYGGLEATSGTTVLVLINNAEMAAIKRDVVSKTEQNHANPAALTPAKEPDVSEYKARYLAKKELLNRVIAQTEHRLTNTMRIIGKKRKLWMNMPVRMMSSRVCLMLTGTIKIDGRLMHDTVDRHKCECGNDTSSTRWLEHWLDECRTRRAPTNLQDIEQSQQWRRWQQKHGRNSKNNHTTGIYGYQQ